MEHREGRLSGDRYCIRFLTVCEPFETAGDPCATPLWEPCFARQHQKDDGKREIHQRPCVSRRPTQRAARLRRSLRARYCTRYFIPFRCRAQTREVRLHRRRRS